MFLLLLLLPQSRSIVDRRHSSKTANPSVQLRPVINCRSARPTWAAGCKSSPSHHGIGMIDQDTLLCAYCGKEIFEGEVEDARHSSLRWHPTTCFRCGDCSVLLTPDKPYVNTAQAVICMRCFHINNNSMLHPSCPDEIAVRNRKRKVKFRNTATTRVYLSSDGLAECAKEPIRPTETGSAGYGDARVQSNSLAPSECPAGRRSEVDDVQTALSATASAQDIVTSQDVSSNAAAAAAAGNGGSSSSCSCSSRTRKSSRGNVLARISRSLHDVFNDQSGSPRGTTQSPAQQRIGEYGTSVAHVSNNDSKNDSNNNHSSNNNKNGNNNNNNNNHSINNKSDNNNSNNNGQDRKNANTIINAKINTGLGNNNNNNSRFNNNSNNSRFNSNSNNSRFNNNNNTSLSSNTYSSVYNRSRNSNSNSTNSSINKNSSENTITTAITAPTTAQAVMSKTTTALAVYGTIGEQLLESAAAAPSNPNVGSAVAPHALVASSSSSTTEPPTADNECSTEKLELRQAHSHNGVPTPRMAVDAVPPPSATPRMAADAVPPPSAIPRMAADAVPPPSATPRIAADAAPLPSATPSQDDCSDVDIFFSPDRNQDSQLLAAASSKGAREGSPKRELANQSQRSNSPSSTFAKTRQSSDNVAATGNIEDEFEFVDVPRQTLPLACPSPSLLRTPSPASSSTGGGLRRNWPSPVDFGTSTPEASPSPPVQLKYNTSGLNSSVSESFRQNLLLFENTIVNDCGQAECDHCLRPVLDQDSSLRCFGRVFHKSCFYCSKCTARLRSTNYCDKDGKVYCRRCYTEDAMLPRLIGRSNAHPNSTSSDSKDNISSSSYSTEKSTKEALSRDRTRTW